MTKIFSLTNGNKISVKIGWDCYRKRYTVDGSYIVYEPRDGYTVTKTCGAQGYCVGILPTRKRQTAKGDAEAETVGSACIGQIVRKICEKNGVQLAN